MLDVLFVIFNCEIRPHNRYSGIVGIADDCKEFGPQPFASPTPWCKEFHDHQLILVRSQKSSKEEDNSGMRISRVGIQKTKDLLRTCVVLRSQYDTIHLLQVLAYDYCIKPRAS